MSCDILIIDDELSLAHNIRDYLAIDGLHAHVCGDGESGLELFASCQYHVVITDISLPGVDGFVVLEQLKVILPAVKVIVISAYGSRETGSTAIAAGAYDYLRKPLVLSKLGSVVARALAEVDGGCPTAP
jgi:DNA-binding NtrC family response regulator